MHTFCGWIRQGMQGAAVLALLLLPLCAQTGLAQAQPRAGGELVMAVPSEPPSYDGHREETFGLIHPVAPFYSPYGSPIFKAVQQKRCKALYTALTKSPTAPEDAVGEGSERSNVDQSVAVPP